MDLNHDKQIQSLLCYRYTIGQAVAFERLNLSRAQSRLVKTFNRCIVEPSFGALDAGSTIQRFNDATMQRN